MTRSVLHAPTALFMSALMLIAAGSALADPAPRWRHIGDGKGITGFMDMASIVRNGAASSAKVMIVEDAGRTEAGGMDHAVITMGFDCPGHGNQMQYAVAYDSTGRKIADAPMDGAMEVADFTDPETVKMFSIVCDNAPPPPSPEFSTIDSAVAWARAQGRRT